MNKFCGPWADHSDMIRNTDSIYRSYVAIMNNEGKNLKASSDRQTVVRSPIEYPQRQKLSQYPRWHRRGYYMFRESIIRGYVRLRAEEQGCELLLDLAATSAESEKDLKWRPRSSGRFQPHSEHGLEDKRKTEFHG